VNLVSSGAADSVLTLTATANYPIGSSGYVLAIFDETTGVRLGFCYGSSGANVCSGGRDLQVTTVPKGATSEVSGVAHRFVAVVAGGTTSYPPSNVAAISDPVTASPWAVSLTSTLNADKTLTLAATANYRISLSSYTLAVYDATTGKRVTYCYGAGGAAGCAGGTTAVVTTVPQGTSTEVSSIAHQYVAVVATSSSSYPPPNLAAASAPLAVDGWSVTLSRTPNSDGSLSLSATSSYNIGASSYTLALYNLTTGTRVSGGYCYGTGSTRCLGGDTLQKVIAASGAYDSYAAVVSNSSTGYPPPNIAAQS
jgi:hypothetical protein